MIPLAGAPSDSIFIKYVPVSCRFTTVTFIYALSRAVVYIITSFGLVYLTEGFGYYGLWVIGIPIAILSLLGIHHYIKLEKNFGNFPEPRSSNKVLASG